MHFRLGVLAGFVADADHIAAIDNTTRKLLSEGKRPVSLGFWFSLGHSTIVFALAFCSKPWHMYPVGVLFGLGFDTATEVGLLILAAGAAAFALPWYAILVLPVLFAAGMSLLDTIEIISIFTDKLGIESGPFAAIANLDLNFVGYGIVALFFLTWMAAPAVWRFGRIEEKWTAGLRAGPHRWPDVEVVGSAAAARAPVRVAATAGMQ